MPLDETRLATLEARLRQLEDIEAIRSHLSVYGFNADQKRIDAFLQGWTDDGVMDLSEDTQAQGKGQMAQLLSAPNDLPTQHIAGNLTIRVEGDVAWAEGYALVVTADDGGPRILNASYNHWDFVRSQGAWKMSRRTRRKLGGTTPGGDVVTRYRD